jgi:hypothetical protein
MNWTALLDSLLGPAQSLDSKYLRLNSRLDAALRTLRLSEKSRAGRVQGRVEAPRV